MKFYYTEIFTINCLSHWIIKLQQWDIDCPFQMMHIQFMLGSCSFALEDLIFEKLEK